MTWHIVTGANAWHKDLTCCQRNGWQSVVFSIYSTCCNSYIITALCSSCYGCSLKWQFNPIKIKNTYFLLQLWGPQDKCSFIVREKAEISTVDISKTRQLTSKQSRWVNGSIGEKKKYVVLILGWTVPFNWRPLQSTTFGLFLHWETNTNVSC